MRAFVLVIPALAMAGCYCAHRVDRFTYGRVDAGAGDAATAGDSTIERDAATDAGADPPRPFAAVTAGGAHTCAVRDGTVLCWGRNAEGQVGDGTVLSPRTEPVVVASLQGVDRLALGRFYTCALRNSGPQVFCWGANEVNQLGVFDGLQRSSPTLVQGVSPVEIAAGARHACARRQTGLVGCWGDNSAGQLGDATGLPQPYVTDVWGLSDAISIASGERHGCAVRASGEVVCWGANEDGQLGDGRNTPSLQPDRPVEGLTDATAVSAGSAHTCAVRATGNVVCWGRNSDGQLGNGSLTASSVPVQVTGLTDAVEVSAGSLHTCARQLSGPVVCWGSNAYGQLGDGRAPMRSPFPVDPIGLSDASDISAGGGHSCAVVSGGRLACWGSNDSAQLGDGTTINRSAPVPVLER